MLKHLTPVFYRLPPEAPMLRCAAIALTFLAAAAATADAAQTRTEFLALVRPKSAPLRSTVERLAPTGDLIREKVYFQSEPGQRVAMLVVRPKNASRRRPAVLALHGTRGRKEGMEPWLTELAGRGFVACATDARWHGELAQGDYEDAIIESYRTGKGHPWLYETVTDTIRALDYLQTRTDVDGERIGMIGISMGGMNTWLTAAADPRVKVAVPCIGVTSFGYQLEKSQHGPRCATLPRFHQAVAKSLGEPTVTARVARKAWSKVLPGIADRFDCPRMLEAIAPRPLLILNGEDDDRCPLEGVRQCYAAANAAYKKAGAADRLKLIVAPDTGHRVTDAQQTAALDWFVRWLRP
ncbi:MAG: alpha/beta hydrolase family protein [Actinomycetota bacterium]